MKPVKSLLALLLATSSVWSFAQCEDTKLGRYMDDIKVELKSLSFEVKKERYQAAATRIEKIQSLLTQSANEEPYLLQDLEGDDRHSKQAEYDKAMQRLIETFQRLNEAVATEDQSAIKENLREISKLRKIGHRAFQVDC